jgi:hypothetical protein
MRGAPEVADDGRQRRGHDRLIKRGQQYPQHQGDQHHPQLPTMQG